MQITKARFALTLCGLLSCCAPLLLEAASLSPPQTAAATSISGLSERPVYYKRFVRRRPSPHDKVLDIYEVREVYYVRRTTVKPPRQLNNEEMDRQIFCDFNPTLPECAETVRKATTSSTTEPRTKTTTTTAATTKATTTKATATEATTTTTTDFPFLPILTEATTEDDYMLPEEDDEEDLDDTDFGKPSSNYDNEERTEYEAPEEQQEEQELEEEEDKKQEEDENDYMDHINNGSIGGLDMA